MINNDTNQKLRKKNVDEEYIFFIQLWHELLCEKTLDTYQYKLFNSYTALCELNEVIDKTISKIYTSFHNIKSCVEESASLIKADVILIKKDSVLWKMLTNHLFNAIKPTYSDNELLTLKYQISYAIAMLKDTYLTWIFAELDSAIKNDEKDLIVFCSKSLISQCIFHGWSTQCLYSCDRFFMKNHNTVGTTPMDDFTKFLSSSDNTFKVYINSGNIKPTDPNQGLTEILNGINISVMKAKEIIESYDTELQSSLLTKFNSKNNYIIIEVKAKDVFSASYHAIQKLSNKINVISFYNQIQPWDIKDIKNIIAINTNSLYIKDIMITALFKTYDCIASSGSVFKSTLEIINDSSFEELQNKLLASFSCANMSRASLFQQEKYMTLWIALESLTRTEMYKDIISNVKTYVPSALSIRYFFRLIRNFAEDLKRCNVSLEFSSKTIDPNSSKTILVENIITVLKDDTLYSELENKCECSYLLKYRVVEIKKIFSDIEYATERIKTYKNHISWQIQRLYRIRNEIAHSAHVDINCMTIYIEHLYDYLSTFITEIISCSKNSNTHALSGVFCRIQDNSTIFETLTENKKVSASNQKLIDNTLFKTGIISFL